MNLALIFQHKILTGLHRLLSNTPAPQTHAHQLAPSHALAIQVPTKLATCNNEVQDSTAISSNAVKVMPLRVLRVIEKGQPRACTGRLVISGRMADVCAELDRLVAREAALH